MIDRRNPDRKSGARQLFRLPKGAGGSRKHPHINDYSEDKTGENGMGKNHQQAHPRRPGPLAKDRKSRSRTGDFPEPVDDLGHH